MGDVVELSPREAERLLRNWAYQAVGVCLEDFIANWFSGVYGDDPDDDPGALELAMLLPFVGIDPWKRAEGE